MRAGRILSVLSLTLFVVACFSPTIHHVVPGRGPTPRSAQPGWLALSMGWIPPVTVPWSANLMLVGGLLLTRRRRYRGAYCLGFVASLTALSTFCVVEAASLMIGYYLWQASFVVFAVGAYLASGSEGRKPDAALDDRLE